MRDQFRQGMIDQATATVGGLLKLDPITGLLPRNPVTGQVTFNLDVLMGGDYTNRFNELAFQWYRAKRAEGLDDWDILAEIAIETVHLALDIIGLVPGLGEIADLANAGLYTLEGQGFQGGVVSPIPARVCASV